MKEKDKGEVLVAEVVGQDGAEVRPKKELPEAMKAKQWGKGVSGNPAGRPKKKAIEKKAEELLAQRMHDTVAGSSSKKLLDNKAALITNEIISIALAPSKEVVSEKQEGKKVVRTIRVVHPEGKLKCLLACFDRLIPTLKVVEVNDPNQTKKVKDMTDDEIVEMMQRMVQMVQANQGLPEPGKLDG